MKKTIEVNIVDENFKTNYRSEPVNKPVKIEIDITDIKPTTTTVTFRCDIPNHIYNTLLDTDKEYVRDKFDKRITSYTISGLVERLRKLSAASIQQHFFKNGDNSKVIIVKFDNSFDNVSNEWAGGNEGISVRKLICLPYCIISETNTFSLTPSSLTSM